LSNYIHSTEVDNHYQAIRCPGCNVPEGVVCDEDCPEYKKRILSKQYKDAARSVWGLGPLPQTTETPTALATQVGGDHYKSLAIQPIEYITKNNLGWCEGNVIKYISRWKQKGQHADLDKVIHYVNLLKELDDTSRN
jgi:hypothetical protein